MTSQFPAVSFPATRMRRMRSDAFSRRMMSENRLDASCLIQPFFVIEGDNARQAVPSMPEVERYSIDLLVEQCALVHELGIPAIVLFAVTDDDAKTDGCETAYDPDGLMQRAVRAIKSQVPALGVITDVALDPYSVHGQDGLMDASGYIVNDETLAVLVKQALSHAEAGADVVGPSDMMDGRVRAIREALESAGRRNTRILSYSAKYASCLYSPFRDAVGSASNLRNADKCTYQMDPANRQEAMREVAQDIAEGADMVMIKPGLPYLDIIRDTRDHFGVPTFAYNVSGEYSMIKAAAQQGWIDERKAVMEIMMCFRRAGCDGVLTYHALQIARWLQDQA